MIEFNTIIFIFLLLLIYLTNNAIFALLSLILIFSSYFNTMLYLKTFFIRFTTDLILLASYFFNIHPVYLFFSMLLLLVALFVTIFLSTEYVSSCSFILSSAYININYKKLRYILIFSSLLLFILISFFVFKSPILLIIFMAFCSLMQIASVFPSVHERVKFLILLFIKFLLRSGLLSLNFFTYNFFHFILTFRQFKIISLVIAFICIGHLAICRYIFYLRIEHVTVPFYFLILFVFGFFIFFIRGFMTFSFFIIPYTFCHFKHIGHLLLTAPEIPEPHHTSAAPIKFGGMFNKHNHHHYYPPEIPRSFFHRNLGIGLAVTGVGLTCYACYQYKITADAAVRSADAAIRSADAAIRSADVAEVAAGLMTREEFNSKWKKH